jgi:hypothetical protein
LCTRRSGRGYSHIANISRIEIAGTWMFISLFPLCAVKIFLVFFF